MGKTTLCNTVTGLIQGIGTASGSVRLAGEEILGLPPNRDHRARRRLRPAGAAGSGRRSRSTSTCASRRKGHRGAVDRRARLPDVPAARRAQGQRRRRALGGRAADARDRPRAALQPAPARHGRADRGSRAGDRPAGRRDAEATRRRRRDLGAPHRAEPRRRDRGRRHRRRDGERPHRAVDARVRARRRSRAAAAAARRPGRRGGGERRGACRRSRDGRTAGCGRSAHPHREARRG